MNYTPPEPAPYDTRQFSNLSNQAHGFTQPVAPTKGKTVTNELIDRMRSIGGDCALAADALEAQAAEIERRKDYAKKEMVRGDERTQACLDAWAERDTLRAELEAIKKDAARYRWLRKHDGSLVYKDVRCFVEKPLGPVAPDLVEVSGRKLDAAIDAAMKRGEA